MEDLKSNCCDARILMQDKEGQGKCMECGENCTPVAGMKILIAEIQKAGREYRAASRGGTPEEREDAALRYEKYKKLLGNRYGSR